MNLAAPAGWQAWPELLAPCRLNPGHLLPTALYVAAWCGARAWGVSPWALQHLLTLWVAYAVVGLWLAFWLWACERTRIGPWAGRHARWSGLVVALGALLLATAGALLAMKLGAWQLGWPQAEALWRQLPAPLTFALALHGLPLLGRWRQWRRQQGQRSRQAQQAVLSDLARQVTQSELKALQAQMEPHFLYNTLAGIQYLVRHNPALADEMLGHLHRYLRLALPSMRSPMSTLAHELELATHYLALAQMRLGERLRFEMPAVDPALATQALAPLMLGTLVENALQHGIEPSAKGGTIRVLVQREDETSSWQLLVEDDGVGLSPGPAATAGTGLGLHNLRERLSLLHGPRARLSVSSRPGGGVRAALHLPWQPPHLDVMHAGAASDVALNANA